MRGAFFGEVTAFFTVESYLRNRLGLGTRFAFDGKLNLRGELRF